MARQVNTKFLTTLTVGFLAALVGLFVVHKLLTRRHNPQQLYELAQKYEKQGSTELAISYYGQAVDADPRNVSYRVKFGDVLSALRADSQSIDSSVKQWEAALEDDPKNPQALKRLIDMYISACENDPSVGSFDRLQRRSKTMSQMDPQTLPDDIKPYPLRAKAWMQIAALGQWILGATKTQAEVEKCIAALRELMPQIPDMVEIPYYAAQAYVKFGRGLREQSLPDAAEARFDQARGVFDAAMKLRPDDPILCFRYFQTLQVIAPTGSVDNDKKYAPLMKDLIDKASSLVQKTDRSKYIEIKVAAAQFFLRDGKLKETDAAMKALQEEFPDSLLTQVIYGSLLRNMPSRRQEAVDVLSKVIEDPTMVGYRARQRNRLEFRRAPS